MELSIGKVSKMFGVSRTALLYYDSLGLLKPSARSGSGYRMYNDSDIDRLGHIILLRKTGVPLEEIARLLEASDLNIMSSLLKRLGQLNYEIEAIKEQQNMIVRIINSSRLYHGERQVDKTVWKAILENAGINEENGDKWHADFEKHSPEQHHKFLGLLGFSEEEISEIRDYYREL